MPTLYRILHKPSGMYFCPSRELKLRLADGDSIQQRGFYAHSNLSKQGKVYTRKPNIGQIGTYYYTHLISSARELNVGFSFRASCKLKVDPCEWEIQVIENQG